MLLPIQITLVKFTYPKVRYVVWKNSMGDSGNFLLENILFEKK